MTDKQPLLFTQVPHVTFATNLFVNTPIILQYETTPLVGITPALEHDTYTTAFTIFDDSGTKLAVAKGAQIYRTDEGKKANLTLQHRQGLTVCKQGDRTIFEIRRSGPAAIAAEAELFAPDGSFVVAPANLFPQLFNISGKPLTIGGATIQGNTFANCKIGVHVYADGRISLGS